MRDSDKYYAAFLKQKLKERKRLMFQQQPYTTEHTEQVILFDKERVEVRRIVNNLKKGYSRPELQA